ncbi:tripartite motif-containing protein [Pimephales promelas]|nr:tripartite motif-containing protein [Pimephales promelas]
MYLSQHLYFALDCSSVSSVSSLGLYQCVQPWIRFPLRCILSAMASAAWSPEAFACPICLETLSDPATLPCGHTYCLVCIQKHWDQPSSKGSCECPQCRQRFTPRPVLARSNVLMEALEKLRLSERDGPPSVPVCAEPSGLYPTLPTGSPELCPLHQQPLELYCCLDQQRVCDECGLLGHKGHQVVRPDEQQHKIQQELIGLNTRIEGSIADRERVVQSLPQASEAHQVSLQQLMEDSQAVFGDVLRSVGLGQSQVLELLHTHQIWCSTHTQAQTQTLHQEITLLRQKQQQIRSLQSIQDPLSLLQAFAALDCEDPCVSAAMEIVSPQALMMSEVRSTLHAFREALENLTRTSLSRVFRVVNDAATLAQSSSQSCDPGVVSSQSQPPSLNPASQITEVKCASVTPDDKPEAKASSPATQERHTNQGSANPVEGSASCCLAKPAPRTREEMLKFRTDLTLDPNSVFRQIRLSDGYRKATLCAESQNYPAHADRFVFWRQVMCAEPLAGGPSYWELEWTGQRVNIRLDQQV